MLMKPQLLMLALDTPLEQLLELPQAIRMVTSVRDDLARYTPSQLMDVLRCVNGMIEAAIQEARTRVGDDRVERGDSRDLDWLLDAINDEHLLVPAGLPEVDAKDYYRVLTLYKVGCAVNESFHKDQVVLSEVAVAALLEAMEALMMAELLPPRRSLKDEIAEAWHKGMMPDPDNSEEVQDALSRAAHRAADSRHAKNRQTKKRALDLYFGSEYSSISVAAAIIGEQVFRATDTVRKWIFEARRERGLTSE